MTGPETGASEPDIEYLTVPEIAQRLRVSRATVYRLLHAGHLAGIRVGNLIRVPRPAVDDYLTRARLDQNAGPPTPE